VATGSPGGLFELDYQSPSSETRIVVDLAVKLVGLAIVHWVWRRGRGTGSGSESARALGR